MQAATMTITPFSPLGARVDGVDLSETLDAETADLLRRAFDEHALLLFRDQTLQTSDLLRTAGIFGQVSDQGEAPGGINWVSNVNQPGLNEAGQHTLRGGDGELKMHFDHCFQEHVLRGIMLYAHEIPPEGGDTLFSDMRLVTRALPAETRDRFEGLSIRHKSYLRTGQPQADHPLMFPHPRTGEKVLFFSKLQAREILGIPKEESDALLEYFPTLIERPEVMFRHRWQPKDVVVWDNLALQHMRETFDPSFKRHLQRVQIG